MPLTADIHRVVWEVEVEVGMGIGVSVGVGLLEVLDSLSVIGHVVHFIPGHIHIHGSVVEVWIPVSVGTIHHRHILYVVRK